MFVQSSYIKFYGVDVKIYHLSDGLLGRVLWCWCKDLSLKWWTIG